MSYDDMAEESSAAAPRMPPRKKKNAPTTSSGKPAKPSSGKPASGKSASRKPEESAAPPAKKVPQWVGGVLLALMFIPILAFAIFMAVRQERHEAGEEAAFAAEIDQLLQAPKEGTPPPGEPGLFAEIDVDERKLHVLHSTLWNDMRASTPAEANYIVQVDTTRDEVTTYTGGSKGIKLTINVTVIDKPSWTVMGRKTFVGEDPPLVAVDRGPDSDVVGTPPDRQEVIAYYRGLAGMK
jgi:hypothetical protein